MFIKVTTEDVNGDNAEFFVNSNMITEVFEYEDNWYIRTTNTDEYPIPEDVKKALTGEGTKRKRSRKSTTDTNETNINEVNSTRKDN